MPRPIRIDADLELRLLQPSHTPALFALVERCRDDLRRWQNWPDSIHSLRDMELLVARLIDKRRERDGFDMVLFYRGQAVGKLGLVYIDWTERRTEFGYWLATPAQGRGLMTRSCAVLIDLLFRTLPLETLHIRCAVDNQRSRAIPERLGFTCEGVLPYRTWLRGDQIQEVLFTLTAAQWRERL